MFGLISGFYMGLYPEWLETDGLGGYAMGSIDGIPRRRYHSLLIGTLRPPVERVNLVNAVEAFIHCGNDRYPLTSFYYAPGVVHPPAGHRITRFLKERAVPTWHHELPGGVKIEASLFMSTKHPGTFLSWKLSSPLKGVKLTVRPLLSCRNYHWLNRANDFFRFDSKVEGERIQWKPYEGIPSVVARSNGNFVFSPVWYYDFFYQEENARGFDAAEDLASPGEFSWTFDQGKEAVLFFGLEDSEGERFCTGKGSVLEACAAALEEESARRESFSTPLQRAGDAYLVKRGEHRTIIAGYPWFTDWGRDTFISIRGLCIETGRLHDAESIFLAWIASMKDGMIPNCFPDLGTEPGFNTVDASLWFVISAWEFLKKAEESEFELRPGTRQSVENAILSILESYYTGTRYYIKADEEDGLLSAGTYGTQLTWMDAAFGGYVFTPRSGKPVEIQALWINALQIGARISRQWTKPAKTALQSFEARFWDEQQNCLFDVIDVNGTKNVADPRFRPNQIFAVGGLPFQVLKGDKAASVVASVERHLVTPFGLRSLAPFEKEYKAFYEGGDYERCSAYHQGTVWTWLMGPFIEAWVRVHRNTVKARKDARRLFFEPLINLVGEAGIGHLPEIADANEPHYPRGCPFQAWSVAEALRMDLDVLKIPVRTRKTDDG